MPSNVQPQYGIEEITLLR